MSTETGAPVRRVVEWALRLGLAGVLGYAGVQKALAPADFVEQVANYQWLPESALLVAAFLPSTEIVVALGLLLPWASWRGAAALLATGMFGVFTLAVARAYALDIDVDCGCFGAGSGEIGAVTIVRNLALTGAAGLTLWWSQRRSAGEAPAT